MESEPKTGVLGNGTVAVECCRHLLKEGESIGFVVGDARDDGENDWQLSLKQFAESEGLRFYQPGRINEEKWYEFFEREAPDYLLSFQYRRIIKRRIIESAKKLAANLHFAPLPKYRGMYPIAWALLNGERQFGVTIHTIAPGVDSGEIISQRMFPIEEEDTARKLYFKCIEKGVELFKETWPKMKSMAFELTPQNPKEVIYYPKDSIDFSKNRVRWEDSCEKVFDFIRAYIFVPFQLPATMHKGEELKIAKVRRGAAEERGKAGEVLEISEEGVEVACGSGSVIVALTDKVDENFPPQTEFLEKVGITRGSRFS